MHIKCAHNNPQIPIGEKEETEHDLDILKEKYRAESYILLSGMISCTNTGTELVAGWEWMMAHKFNMLLQKRVNTILEHLKKDCILRNKWNSPAALLVWPQLEFCARVFAQNFEKCLNWREVRKRTIKVLENITCKDWIKFWRIYLKYFFDIISSYQKDQDSWRSGDETPWICFWAHHWSERSRLQSPHGATSKWIVVYFLLWVCTGWLPFR